MKRKIFIISMAVMMALLFCLPAFGVDLYPTRNNDGKIGKSGKAWGLGYFYDLYVQDDLTVTDDAAVGGDLTVTGTLTPGTLSYSRERSFVLPLTGFITSAGDAVTASTAPGLEVDDSIPAIVWADGETTPVMTTFRIPADYSSGGAFRVLATESNSTTPNQVDFDVYVNADGTASDSSATGQTPVALAGTTSTPDVITLTPATDFSSLAAGQWVTIRIWRDDTATGTGDLEIKGVEFFYTATN